MNTSMNPQCITNINSCATCGKEFAFQQSLNRHLGQNASCRLDLSKPDIASMVHLKPSNHGSPLIIPNTICFAGPSQSQDDGLVSSPNEHKKYDYYKSYLEKVEEYANSIANNTTFLYLRIDPKVVSSKSPTGRNRFGSPYDPYILKVVKETELTELLCEKEGITLTESISEQVTTWMDEVLEAIEDDVEREDNDFAIPPSFTDAPPSSQTAFSRVKIDHVWKFFRAHLKVYDEEGDLKFSFDAIPSANNDLSSLEGEHLTYQSHTSDDSMAQTLVLLLFMVVRWHHQLRIPSLCRMSHHLRGGYNLMK